LREALRLVAEEGLEARFARHRKNHEALAAGLGALGLALAAEEGHRLPMLNAVTVPDGVDEARVRTRLLAEHGIEIGGRLGPLEDDLDLASLRTAIERTRPVYARAGDAAAATAADRLLAILDSTNDPKARRAAVARAFRVVRFREPLLLTAYYEPELAARFARDASFRYPLYARPPDLVDVEPRTLDETCTCRRLSGRVEGTRLQPYPSRADIEGGAL